ncbi:hypothetical protein BC629DRAFT_1601871 [Irpex lacteus]|nr:hypothetical protein BC629DRAFT_1601871 [Irpex lacteus]
MPNVDAHQNNLKLFNRFKLELSEESLPTYVSTAEKLAHWMRKEQAFYPEAKPYIVNFLELAQVTLYRACRITPSPKHPFHISQCPPQAANLAEAYVRLVQAVRKYEYKFVEPDFRSRLADVFSTVDPIPSKPTPSSNRPRPPPVTAHYGPTPPPHSPSVPESANHASSKSISYVCIRLYSFTSLSNISAGQTNSKPKAKAKKLSVFGALDFLSSDLEWYAKKKGKGVESKADHSDEKTTEDRVEETKGISAETKEGAVATIVGEEKKDVVGHEDKPTELEVAEAPLAPAAQLEEPKDEVSEPTLETGATEREEEVAGDAAVQVLDKKEAKDDEGNRADEEPMDVATEDDDASDKIEQMLTGGLEPEVEADASHSTVQGPEQAMQVEEAPTQKAPSDEPSAPPKRKKKRRGPPVERAAPKQPSIRSRSPNSQDFSSLARAPKRSMSGSSSESDAPLSSRLVARRSVSDTKPKRTAPRVPRRTYSVQGPDKVEKTDNADAGRSTRTSSPPGGPEMRMLKCKRPAAFRSSQTMAESQASSSSRHSSLHAVTAMEEVSDAPDVRRATFFDERMTVLGFARGTSRGQSVTISFELNIEQAASVKRWTERYNTNDDPADLRCVSLACHPYADCSSMLDELESTSLDTSRSSLECQRSGLCEVILV